MKVRSIICCVLLCLSASCTKEEEDNAGSSVDESSTSAKRMTRPTEADGAGVRSKSVGNRYADQHWLPGTEPDNEWTDDFKAARSADKKIEVIRRKQASGPEMLAPLIRMALRDPDERVRAEAAGMIRSFAGVSGLTSGAAPFVGRPGGSLVGSPGGGSAGPGASTQPGEDAEAGNDAGSDAGPVAVEAVDLVVGAVHDPDREVRLLAMETALELGRPTQLEIYRSTIVAPDESIRKMTITELGRIASKPAFEVLITGLQHPDSGFRGEVNEEINLLVDRRFETFDEARAWWAESAGNFADNMVHIGGRR